MGPMQFGLFKEKVVVKSINPCVVNSIAWWNVPGMGQNLESDETIDYHGNPLNKPSYSI